MENIQKYMMDNKLKFVEVSSIDELHKHKISNISIAIGVFDGLHLGHRRLLGELSAESRLNNSLPVVMTFFPHPRQLIIKRDKEISLLLPHHQKLKLLRETGIGAVVTIAFTQKFASLSADEFLRVCLSPELISLSAVLVGKNWRFGRGGGGDTALLAKFATGKGIRFKAVDELKIGGAKVSSSSIRKAVANGDLAEAEKMLGRPYSLCGKVKKGLAFASGNLGFPTANIETGDYVIPPEGVYRGAAVVAEKEYSAAISIGTAQSIRRDSRNRELLIEAHILDFTGSIYGDDIEIKFFEYLREQRYFSDMSNLKEQISKDIEYVRKIQNRSRMNLERNTKRNALSFVVIMLLVTAAVFGILTVKNLLEEKEGIDEERQRYMSKRNVLTSDLKDVKGEKKQVEQNLIEIDGDRKLFESEFKALQKEINQQKEEFKNVLKDAIHDSEKRKEVEILRIRDKLAEKRLALLRELEKAKE